jgi:hypothetical protein
MVAVAVMANSSSPSPSRGRLAGGGVCTRVGSSAPVGQGALGAGTQGVKTLRNQGKVEIAPAKLRRPVPRVSRAR